MNHIKEFNKYLNEQYSLNQMSKDYPVLAEAYQTILEELQNVKVKGGRSELKKIKAFLREGISEVVKL